MSRLPKKILSERYAVDLPLIDYNRLLMTRDAINRKAFLYSGALPFVYGSIFARNFLTDVIRCKLLSFVRPLCAVHLTAGLDEVRMLALSEETGSRRVASLNDKTIPLSVL